MCGLIVCEAYDNGQQYATVADLITEIKSAWDNVSEENFKIRYQNELNLFLKNN